MKFSIIVPIYKVEKYLGQCIDSVLIQTFTDFELILVDDGSPDNCPAICDAYAREDDRIRVIHKVNGGLSDARNVGLDVAKGEYILFLDSDDWWDNKDALKIIDIHTKQELPDIIIFGHKKYYSRERSYGELWNPISWNGNFQNEDHATFLMQNNIFVACAWDKAIKRELIDARHLRFVKGQLSEDIEWCSQLLLNIPSVAVLKESIYVYRQQVATSISVNIGIKNIQDILEVIKKYAFAEAPVPLLHFLANQYVLLITNLMRLERSDRAPFDKTIKSYWWLLDYNWYPYVKRVSKIKFLGYNIVKRLLSIYYRAVR